MGYKGNQHSQAENDNHSNQMNSTNEAYWESRGYEDRPEEWEEMIDDHDSTQKK